MNDPKKGGPAPSGTATPAPGKDAAPPDERALRLEWVSKVMDPAYYGLSGQPMNSPSDVSRALRLLRAGGANLIGPEAQIDYIPRNYMVSLRWAFLDHRYPEMTGTDGRRTNKIWYEQKGGGLSPHLVGLNQLGSLCAINWVDFKRTDDGSQPLLWRGFIHAEVTFFDGTMKTAKEPIESDLREGSAESKLISPKLIDAARAKGLQRACSNAKGRIIRELLSLKQVYTEDEAAMPFVYPKMIYVPPADPELDRLIALRELGLVSDLYGPRQPSRIIDVASEPERLALPDHGPRKEVDFQAEIDRLAQGDRVQNAQQEAPPDMAGLDDGPPDDDPVCEHPRCGEALSHQRVAWFRERGLKPTCATHTPPAEKKGGGAK